MMSALAFASMYVLMYAMVNTFANVYSNLNQLYTAVVMTAPMVVIELVVMRAMYHNKTWNGAFTAVSIVAGVAAFMLIRGQVGIGDRQFLRSMIPHHASAILMCKEAAIRDQDIAALCRAIVSNQQAEIDQMKAKLGQLDQ